MVRIASKKRIPDPPDHLVKGWWKVAAFYLPAREYLAPP